MFVVWQKHDASEDKGNSMNEKIARLGAMSAVLVLLVGGMALTASATKISMKLSGPGVVNDSTVKANQKISLDVYAENDDDWAGITFGFKISSPTIKAIVYPKDSTAMNRSKNAHGFNGWQDNSIFDLGGVRIAEADMNGELPDVIGVGAAVVKNKYKAHPLQKILSFDVLFKEEGKVTVDSTFFPPGGFWKVARSPRVTPAGKDSQQPVKWGGPVRFKVVK